MNMMPLSDTKVRVDICVCTFHRPELADTLTSLAGLSVPSGVMPRVIVADNDTTPSARERVEAIAECYPFDLVYIHAPARNISIARNACLEAGCGDYVAFIDDDETASAGWLTELLKTALREQADVVLGPVRAQYGEETPRWMRRADLHSTFPVWAKGVIRTGYTCNALIRRTATPAAGLRFDPAFGRSGGEDTDYFTRLFAAGGRIVYAPDALTFERVPQSRERFAWLAKRRFRSGQTHGRLLARGRAVPGRVAQIALAGAKAGYCFAAAAFLAPFQVQRNRSALRGIMHVGVVSGLLGMREIRQYGAIEPAEQSNAA